MKEMNPILQFESTVDAIFGVYLDSITGFEKVRAWVEQRQLDTLEIFKESHPELATIEYMDSTSFIYGKCGKGNLNSPDSVEIHRCTKRQYKERNAPGGLNFLFIGNMSLVSIYQFWEDQFRSEIATHLNIDKNDLKEPVMGDIRHLRRSIIHNGGVALPDVEQCEILNWFHKGDIIYLDEKKFETLIYEIKIMVKHLIERQRKL